MEAFECLEVTISVWAADWSAVKSIFTAEMAKLLHRDTNIITCLAEIKTNRIYGIQYEKL